MHSFTPKATPGLLLIRCRTELSLHYHVSFTVQLQKQLHFEDQMNYFLLCSFWQVSDLNKHASHEHARAWRTCKSICNFTLLCSMTLLHCHHFQCKLRFMRCLQCAFVKRAHLNIKKQSKIILSRQGLIRTQPGLCLHKMLQMLYYCSLCSAWCSSNR